MEKWTIIDDFPRYVVSNLGNVKTLFWQNNVNGKYRTIPIIYSRKQI